MDELTSPLHQASGRASARPAVRQVEQTRLKLYPEVAAGGFTRLDGTVQFYTRVNALLEPHFTVLDIGAGRGAAHHDDPVRYRRQLRNLRGKVGKVIGIDVDPVVQSNPSLDEARLIKDGTFPIETSSVDLAICDYVFEHIAEPKAFCAEIERVMKPGGWLCARTPNKHGYISLASRLIPEKLHSGVLKVAQPGRKAEDIFPTSYRLNTPADIRQHLSPARWHQTSYNWNAEPAYFGSAQLAWRAAQLLAAVTPNRFGATLLLFAQTTGLDQGS